MSEVELASFDDTMQFVVAMMHDKFDGDVVNFSKNLDLTVKLIGGQWSGKFDYRSAEFTLRLQHEIIKIFNSVTGSNITLASLRDSHYYLTVNVEVHDGCREIVVKLCELLETIQKVPKEILGKMSGKQILIAFVIWAACSYGGTISTNMWR